MWAITALAVAATLQLYVTPGKLFGMIPVADSVVGTFFYKNQFAAMMELAAPIALWKVFEGEVVAGGLCYAAMFAATLASGSRAGVLLVSLGVSGFSDSDGCAPPNAGEIACRNCRDRAAARWPALPWWLAPRGLAAGLRSGTRLRCAETYWRSTLKMIPLHPWFGSGMGTWPIVFPRFATFDSSIYVNEAHNDWAQWTAEGGIPFTVLLAALVFCACQASPPIRLGPGGYQRNRPLVRRLSPA